jgi:integrase
MRNVPKVLNRHIGKTLMRKIDAATIRAYQDARKAEGVSGRTVNIEVTLIRQVLKRAKRWSVIADDVSNLPENQNVVSKALMAEQKLHLFRTAASKSWWDVAYCAAVIAVRTSCRKVDLLTLRWSDVDLFKREFSIRHSKTEAGTGSSR